MSSTVDQSLRPWRLGGENQSGSSSAFLQSAVSALSADTFVSSTLHGEDSQTLYQGMTLDSVTGLYYERNRNYNPSLGVWISQDPAGYINGADTYQFVLSNPVGNVDPKGLLYRPCSQCYKNFDRETAQLMRQMDREIASLGIPNGATALKIIGSSAVLGATVGQWGGIWGKIVGIIIGADEGLGKIIEWHAYYGLYIEEKKGILDALKNCLKNCQ